MSDGTGESRETNRKKVEKDDFSSALAKIAVAQVFESAGFQGFHQSALDSLSDVALRYIREIAKTSAFYTNISGRSESNALDIIQGLEDLGLSQGFSGASDTNRCVASSGVVREITRYVSEEGENPFAYAIPKFPIVKEKKIGPSFAQVGDLPPSEHIPAWLPVFPEQKTYSQVGDLANRELDNVAKKIESCREGKEVEGSVVNNSDQHVTCNGTEMVPVVVEPVDGTKGKVVVESNPFLAPPLRFGEKEVSLVVIPPKVLDGSAKRELDNHVSDFAFDSPVAEAIESPLKLTETPLNGNEEVKEKVSPNTRPTVQFKLKSFKRKLGSSPRVKIDDTEKLDKIDDTEKMDFLLEVNGDKGERKRRAEQIMKESMEIVEESAEFVD